MPDGLIGLLFFGCYLAGFVILALLHSQGKRPDPTSKNPYDWPTARYGYPYWRKVGQERLGPVVALWAWVLLYPVLFVGLYRLLSR